MKQLSSRLIKASPLVILYLHCCLFIRNVRTVCWYRCASVKVPCFVLILIYCICMCVCIYVRMSIDVLGMSTTAKESADGSYFTINGSKMWITNGTVNGTDTGDVFLVYAKTSLHDSTQVLPRGSNLTSFIVEKGMPGFTLGQKIEDKCGMRASMTAELVYTDVKVSFISHPSFNIYIL